MIANQEALVLMMETYNAKTVITTQEDIVRLVNMVMIQLDREDILICKNLKITQINFEKARV